MKEFGFSAPADIGEALKLMADFGEKATVLAGGTDLMPMIARQHRNPFSYDSPFPPGLILVERRTAVKIECVLEGENHQGKGSV